MPSVARDIVAETQLSIGLESSLMIRAYRVRGLVSSEATQFSATQIDGIPQIGQADGFVPNFVCIGLRVAPLLNSVKQCRVIATFQDMAAVRVSLTSNLMNRGTYVGYGGLPNLVTYTGNKTKQSTVFDHVGDDDVDQILTKVESPIPQMVLTFERVEIPSAIVELPTTRAAWFVGTVNNMKWQGGYPRQWLCTSINAERLDQYRATDSLVDSSGNLIQSVWRVRYSFETRGALSDIFSGWDQMVVYTEPFTGITPPGIDPVLDGFKGIGRPGTASEGNGWDIPFILGETNFNKLNLPTVITGPPVVSIT